MSLDNSTDQAVYDSALHVGANSKVFKLTTASSKIVVLRYEWLVACEQKADDHKFMISASMSSRYKFSDKLILKITLKNSGEEFKTEKFDLKKSTDKQEFEIAYEEKFDEVEVYAEIFISSIKYCTDKWATEIDFKDSNRAHDVVLLVGATKFYVYRLYLATWSRYFDRLFFGSFKEKNQKEVELKDVDPHMMNALLNLIHPQLHWDLGDWNVLEVLKLADQFDIPNLMARCGIVLSNFDNFKNLSLIERLELAYRHNMVHLQVACFERIHQMAPQDYIKFFYENRDRIQQLSEMTVKNII